MQRDEYEYLIGNLSDKSYLVVILHDENMVEIDTNLSQDQAAGVMDVLKEHFELIYIPDPGELNPGGLN